MHALSQKKTLLFINEIQEASLYDVPKNGMITGFGSFLLLQFDVSNIITKEDWNILASTLDWRACEKKWLTFDQCCGHTNFSDFVFPSSKMRLRIESTLRILCVKLALHWIIWIRKWNSEIYFVRNFCNGEKEKSEEKQVEE